MRSKVLILGGIIVDNYLVSEFPVKGQDTLISEQFDRVAGCALNVAVTLKNLEIDPCLVSALGNDLRANQISSYLEKRGLNNDFIFPVKGDTGYCLTLLDPSGERSFMTFRGSEEIFTGIMSNEILKHEFSYAYLTGYFLLNEEYFPEKLRLLRELKARNCKIVFDPGSLVDQLDPEVLEVVLDTAVIAVPNLSEAEKIHRRLGLDKPFHLWCLSRGYELVVLKNGKNPLKIYTTVGRELMMTPFQVKDVDTTGAGDSFAGGLIYGLSQGLPIDKCMEIACACGGITTTFREPHGDFSRKDLDIIMKYKDKDYV